VALKTTKDRKKWQKLKRVEVIYLLFSRLLKEEEAVDATGGSEVFIISFI